MSEPPSVEYVEQALAELTRRGKTAKGTFANCVRLLSRWCNAYDKTILEIHTHMRQMEDCMTVDQTDSLPYRPCVGIMLVNADGRIFTGQRIDSSADAWQMPQGGIDEGEEPRAAALRELFEETGISAAHVEIIAQTRGWVDYDLPAELIPRLWGGKYRGQRQKWFLMRLTSRDDVINIQTETPEFSSWRWQPADQLIGAIVPFKRHVYEQVLAEFEDKL